jgi:hypothetical protein
LALPALWTPLLVPWVPAGEPLVGERLLGVRIGTYHVVDRPRLAEQFVDAYARLLRPHLMIGSFRAPEREPERLLEQIDRVVKGIEPVWAVTGGPAAYALQRFYRDDQVPLLIPRLTPEGQRELRLVPDREGPVVLLRAFGTRCAWRRLGDLGVAHPWLVYAELVHRGEPRALEAADLVREEYLHP